MTRSTLTLVSLTGALLLLAGVQLWVGMHLNGHHHHHHGQQAHHHHNASPDHHHEDQAPHSEKDHQLAPLQLTKIKSHHPSPSLVWVVQNNPLNFFTTECEHGFGPLKKYDQTQIMSRGRPRAPPVLL